METSLTIAEVAERTGLTAYTLRYYERIGLTARCTRHRGNQPDAFVVAQGVGREAGSLGDFRNGQTGFHGVDSRN